MVPASFDNHRQPARLDPLLQLLTPRDAALPAAASDAPPAAQPPGSDAAASSADESFQSHLRREENGAPAAANEPRDQAAPDDAPPAAADASQPESPAADDAGRDSDRQAKDSDQQAVSQENPADGRADPAPPDDALTETSLPAAQAHAAAASAEDEQALSGKPAAGDEVATQRAAPAAAGAGARAAAAAGDQEADAEREAATAAAKSSAGGRAATGDPSQATLGGDAETTLPPGQVAPAEPQDAAGQADRAESKNKGRAARRAGLPATAAARGEAGPRNVELPLPAVAADGEASDGVQAGGSPDAADAQPASPARAASEAAGRTLQSRFAQHVSGSGGPRSAAGPAAGGAEQARFVERVARAVQLTEGRGGVLRLRLHPPELGALRLEVRVQGNALTARLEAETAAARSLLMEHLPLLRERLAEQGVRVEQFDVDLHDRPAGGMPEGPRQQGGGQRDPSAASTPSPDPADAAPRDPAPSPGDGTEQLDVVI